jgi:hypothetical protein
MHVGHDITTLVSILNFQHHLNHTNLIDTTLLVA